MKGNLRYFLILLFLIHAVVVKAQNVDQNPERIPKRIELLFRAPGPIPSISPTEESFRKNGYQIIIRNRYYEPFLKISRLIRLNKESTSNSNKENPILMIYCKISYGGLRKKDCLELYDDCTVLINEDRHSMTKELYNNVLNLMPLGLRELWIESYNCF